ncbi:glycosyltransferase [Candidatus Micrarchaeota archaeon]|nr:glycosyltransferase [Candidatus Micrarchaeota archaeon]
MKPLVSVVIPTYNEEKNIARTLESILSQEFKQPFEIIVADGESTDNTREIAKKYIKGVYKEIKHTIASGRQAGCGHAVGEILVFTDADTIAPKDWLAIMANRFNDPNVVAVYGTAEVANPTFLEKLFARPAFSSYLWILAVLGMPSGAGFNIAVRKKDFDAVKGFKTELVTAEDIELLKKLKKRGKVVFEPKSFVTISPRRIRAWGLLKFTAFHVKNLFEIHFLGKSEKEYERIR